MKAGAPREPRLMRTRNEHMLVRRTAAALALLPTVVVGHGAIITPRSRNSWDYTVGVNTPKDWPTNADCTNVSGTDPADCRNGQAGFYYSQGCSIGCPECDHVSGRVQKDICGLGMKATLPDYARSLNLGAVAGSPQDIYKHNPWRAPGAAPVADVCGLAGGTPWAPEVGNAGDYTTTKFAHHGMNGSLLPKMDTGVRWELGKTAEVTWQVLNNHGGGVSGATSRDIRDPSGLSGAWLTLRACVWLECVAVLVPALPSDAKTDGGVLSSPPVVLRARRALSRRPKCESTSSQWHICDG
eukprot:COSAG02_NODE_13451_length_1392_cov_1.413447_1_plen_297_part_10